MLRRFWMTGIPIAVIFLVGWSWLRAEPTDQKARALLNAAIQELTESNRQRTTGQAALTPEFIDQHAERIRQVYEAARATESNPERRRAMAEEYVRALRDFKAAIQAIRSERGPSPLSLAQISYHVALAEYDLARVKGK